VARIGATGADCSTVSAVFVSFFSTAVGQKTYSSELKLARLRLRPTRHVDTVAPIAGDDELW
jgi:hypothetical protein